MIYANLVEWSEFVGQKCLVATRGAGGRPQKKGRLYEQYYRSGQNADKRGVGVKKPENFADVLSE